MVLTLWCVYFFRNPDRVTPEREGLIISPADGIVQMIAEVSPPQELDMGSEPVVRVSVFMNVFDCHVNRIPCDGRIGKLVYVPGQFLNASLDKASEENERNYYLLKTDSGEEIVVVQIAGLIARRIVTQVSKDQVLTQGERIGMIRFGSRVDVFFNKKNILAKIGQNVIAGESIIAED